MDKVYSKVAELPETLQAVLKRLGYYRADIALQAKERFSPFQGGMSGRRSFVVLVDLATGESKCEMGSWGGSNAFNQDNPVDNDTNLYTIPQNVAVIEGAHGGDRPTSASIVLRPEALAPLLKSGPELSERDVKILAAYKGLTSAGRKDFFQRRLEGGVPTGEELASLCARGLLTKAGTGLKITTEGKNAPGVQRAFVC